MRAPVWEMNEVILAWRRTPEQKESFRRLLEAGVGEVCEIHRGKKRHEALRSKTMKFNNGKFREGDQRKFPFRLLFCRKKTKNYFLPK